MPDIPRIVQAAYRRVSDPRTVVTTLEIRTVGPFSKDITSELSSLMIKYRNKVIIGGA